MKFIKRFFTKKPTEKVRVRIRGGKIIGYHIPAHLTAHNRFAAVRQELACYQIKCNGPFLGGIGNHIR